MTVSFEGHDSVIDTPLSGLTLQSVQLGWVSSERRRRKLQIGLQELNVVVERHSAVM
jgi:hypothetical protein